MDKKSREYIYSPSNSTTKAGGILLSYAISFFIFPDEKQREYFSETNFCIAILFYFFNPPSTTLSINF
jgi:hypothetical protein